MGWKPSIYTGNRIGPDSIVRETLKGNPMSLRRFRIALLVLVLIGGAVGWYWFRPERLFTNRTVSERFSETGTVPLASGMFHGVAHQTSGTATIYRLADGRMTLRLSGFRTSNGPDVVVYLVGASDANDAETVKQAGFLLVGALKGNIGDQTYELPDRIDLTRFRAVTIWCRRFSVNFGTAPLS
jgi:hypothetical protein